MAEWDEVTGVTSVPPVKADSRHATLTILTGSAAGQLLKCAKGALVIGRSPECGLRLEDDGISRNHVRLRTATGGTWVTDLASRNGTFVNGTRIAGELELADGDKIQIGRGTVLRFSYQDNLDESFHENLLSSALRDGLTKLFNKRYLMDRLDSELKFAARHETQLALLMIDIDHFKKVNDTYGHLAGDAVLVHIAQLLARAVRNEDVVARFGGEELAIILRAIGIDAAVQMAERLRKRIEAAPAPTPAGPVSATISIGVAGFPSTPGTPRDSVPPAMPRDSATPETLIDAADRALYRAKGDGRNRTSR